MQIGGEHLVREIKIAVDEDPARERFLLTGSTNFLTVPTISESLAGRVVILRLFPSRDGDIPQSSHPRPQRTPPRQHPQYGGLIDAAGAQLSPHDAVQLESCLDKISPQDASVWRETSTYPADARIKGDPQTATPEFAAQMARAAVQMAQTCISLITGELGYQPAEAHQALARCQHIQQELPNPDTPTQDRNPGIGS